MINLRLIVVNFRLISKSTKKDCWLIFYIGIFKTCMLLSIMRCNGGWSVLSTFWISQNFRVRVRWFARSTLSMRTRPGELSASTETRRRTTHWRYTGTAGADGVFVALMDSPRRVDGSRCKSQEVTITNNHYTWRPRGIITIRDGTGGRRFFFVFFPRRDRTKYTKQQ